MQSDDDEAPWADPAIRIAYEAALGRFILAFNEVDYRLTQLIGWELSTRGREDLTATASRGTFAQRISTAELLATPADASEIASLPFQQLRTVGGHRNALAHGHFDQNPFDGSYRLVLSAKVQDYPIEKINALTAEIEALAETLRFAEVSYHFADVTDEEATLGGEPPLAV
jgi:hypothetical protein